MYLYIRTNKIPIVVPLVAYGKKAQHSLSHPLVSRLPLRLRMSHGRNKRTEGQMTRAKKSKQNIHIMYDEGDIKLLQTWIFTVIALKRIATTHTNIHAQTPANTHAFYCAAAFAVCLHKLGYCWCRQMNGEMIRTYKNTCTRKHKQTFSKKNQPNSQIPFNKILSITIYTSEQRQWHNRPTTTETLPDQHTQR